MPSVRADLTFACVWRTGGEYRCEHVVALALGVERYLTIPYRFVCLTDCGAADAQVLARTGTEPIALLHAWPGWWSKIELFRPELLTGPVFYADLDTIICGSLDDLVLGHNFTVLRDWFTKGQINSALMAWDADMRVIYERFTAAPERIMRDFKTRERWGDQSFIQENAPFAPQFWQDRHTGRIVSYKAARLTRTVPPGVRVICYHGRPRPWETPFWTRYGFGGAAADAINHRSPHQGRQLRSDDTGAAENGGALSQRHE